jgi:drug/metabolite transporter (DMT)-like permease
MSAEPGRWALASFLTCAVLAGANAVGVRFSNRELDPLWGAGLRFGAAAVILLIAVLVLRLPLPRGRAWAGPLTYGVLNFAAAFAFGYYALQYLHAGFGQTLFALVPLATLLLAVAQRQERLARWAVAGTLLACAGVVVMSWGPLDRSIPLSALLAALGSTACFAQTAVLVHRLPNVHPLTTNAIGMAIGAVLLLAGSAVTGEAHILPERAATWASLVFLVLFGSIGVFGLYLVVLRVWPASRASYVFVLAPFVTVALSAWLDDEPVGPGLVVGGLLVLAGVYVGALRPVAG